MERRSSDYPISKFIKAVIAQSELRGAEFMHTLGYRNAASGFRALDQWLDTGAGHPDVLKRLVNAFGVSVESINQAIQETNERFEVESARALAAWETRERARFSPYIHVEVFNTRPTNAITVLALTGGAVRLIRLHVSYAVVSEDTLSRVQEIVREHYTRNEGKIMFFGEVSGYRFVPDWNQSWRLSVDGTILEHDEKHFVLPFRSGASLRRDLLPPLVVGK
jgi:hypothetical protein